MKHNVETKIARKEIAEQKKNNKAHRAWLKTLKCCKGISICK